MKKKGASNIKVSVILSYLLVVSVMITGLIALYNNLVDFSNKKVRNEDTSELIIVGNILSMLYEVESEQDLLTSEGAEQYYAKYDSLIPAVKKNLERLKEYTDDEIRKNKLDSISLLMKIKSENLLDISSLLDSISKSPNIIRETDSRYVPKELNRDISDYLEKINISNPNIARSDTIVITGERKSFINRVRDVFNAKQDSTIVIENKTLVPDVEFRLIVDTIINKVIYSERLDLRRQREIHTDLIRRQEVMSQTNRMLTSQIDELLKNIEHEEIKKSLLLISERSRAISRSQNTMFVVSLLSIIFAIIFAVLFLIDINKSHRYRMQLEQSNKRITDLLSYREMLMLTISHDIKAPTGSILGYIDLMIEEKDNKKSNFYLQNIKLSAQNVLQLVSTLLDFHKLDKGGWQLQESEFSLYSLIEESTNSFKPLADKKGLEFKVENKIPEGMLCFGDNYVLWHIFSNLISNAVKYTSHGQITILANTHETDSKTVLNFAVADTGEGIDIEDQEDIFNEFKQFIKNNNKGEHVEGSGLGLAITKGFVKVVNGEISFTSTKGEGSEFVVEIPLNVITDRDKDRKGFSKYDDLKDVSMLYVDDDPVQLKMMSEIVQKKEINCTTESNPDNVLGIIDSNNFDIILIDIQLGDKSGFDLVRSVNEKLRDQNVEIPVLALSARSDISISMIQAAGFKDFISKPFNFNQLYEKISKYINSSFINSSVDYNLKLNGVSALIEFVKDDIDASSEILKSFINETKESELILKNAIKDNDFVSISKISHKMLPLFRMIGHEKVVGIMEQLERNKHVSKEDINYLMNAIEYSIEEGVELSSHLINK